ncbi:hypothetical protein BW152_00670 [Lactococcus lactis]|nr:hypothetical protein BW152_00670 [Lactococcus lactis]
MDFSPLFEKIIENPVTNTLTPFPPDCIRLHQEVFLFKKFLFMKKTTTFCKVVVINIIKLKVLFRFY